MTAHALRHTAASLAISAGANPKVVQRMLGHASAAMTLDVHADLFDSDLDAVADRLELARQMADETGWRIYDAELQRLRAHTSDDPDARHADLRAAIELAQTQGAPIYELRAAADDFELIGEPARAALMDALNRFPSAQTWPELARVSALLG